MSTLSPPILTRRAEDPFESRPYLTSKKFPRGTATRLLTITLEPFPVLKVVELRYPRVTSFAVNQFAPLQPHCYEIISAWRRQIRIGGANYLNALQHELDSLNAIVDVAVHANRRLFLVDVRYKQECGAGKVYLERAEGISSTAGKVLERTNPITRETIIVNAAVIQPLAATCLSVPT